jgi:NADPH:quinone reductase-like Zn-dependent oxidoreductase
MKASVWTRYGPPDVLQLQEVEKPTPKDDEILVRIHATTVTAGDCETRALKFPIWLALPMRFYMGFGKPTRVTMLGQELAGEVEAVGEKVTRYKVGDQVFGTTGFSLGAYAEYKCLPEDPNDMQGALATKPASLTFEEAAAVPIGGIEALHFLRLGNIQRGETVLINGAGGSIGTFAVQIARSLGAEVTGVDSTEKLDMLREIGAEHVVDYTQEDFTQSGEAYDVIFDVIGKSPFSGSIQSLKPNGRYLLANPRLLHMIRGQWVSARGSKQVVFGAAGQNAHDLITLTEMIEAGTIRPIVDRHYPLEQAAEAHRYVEAGHKKGNVVITVAHGDEA